MLNANEISCLIEDKIKDFALTNISSKEGKITGVADGIVKIYGLSDAQYGEKIIFENGSIGIVLNLEQDSIGAIILGDMYNIAEGQKVRITGEVLTVPVGSNLLGRVVNALGEPIDSGGAIVAEGFAPIEKVAPGVIWRKSISTPLQTGLKSIDSMVPIGRGQRELIIGDRQTGKTALAIDTIINQKDQNVKCIYVAIGQKASSVAGIVSKLQEYGAMEYTVVVVATASDAGSMQYIAPYAGCAIGEYFMDKGEDALIVYDDLTKHAWAYRQISLLLKRPPGREAYPGDIFYLHSRLLERAARVNEEYIAIKTNGQVTGRTGSLTALPIIETQAGDVSAFIPTNVISITDGQIFLETDLFNAGIRPAINAGLSVSRIGGAAQTNLIKKLGLGTRLALAQYRELVSFSQFASELDNVTLLQLERGQRTMELNKQKQYSPISIGLMAISLFVAVNGYLDDIPLKRINEFEEELHNYVKANHNEFLNQLNHNKVFDDIVAKDMVDIVIKFKQSQWVM